jgi:hypothetical protein
LKKKALYKWGIPSSEFLLQHILSLGQQLSNKIKSLSGTSQLFSQHHSKLMFIRNDLKGQGHKIFTSGFLHELAFPKPLSIPLGPLKFFLDIWVVELTYE